MNKRKKFINVSFFLISLTLFIYVIYCNRSESEMKIHNTLLDKVQVKVAEDKYKDNPTTENLFILCSNLLHTKELDMIKQYYPVLLTTENIKDSMSYYLSNNNETYDNVEGFYNTILSCYIIAEGISNDCNPVEMAEYFKMQQGYSFIEVVHVSMLVYFKDNPTELKVFLENLENCNAYVDDYHKEEISLIRNRYRDKTGDSSVSRSKKS